MKRFIVVSSLLILSLIGCRPGIISGIEVAIRNNGNGRITNVELLFTGGAVMAAEIPSTQQQTFKVKPKGESHLVLRFTDGKGQKHDALVDVYFESGYKGKINITIDDAGEVKWENTTSVR